MKQHREQAEALFQAGNRDFLSLRLLIETGRAPHESIGFHAQQACEKFLKTIAVLHGIVFERTHDLVLLQELLKQHNLIVPVQTEVLRALNSYAVQFRYEVCPVAMVKDADCLRAATALAEWASNLIEVEP